MLRHFRCLCAHACLCASGRGGVWCDLNASLKIQANDNRELIGDEDILRKCKQRKEGTQAC